MTDPVEPDVVPVLVEPQVPEPSALPPGAVIKQHTIRRVHYTKGPGRPMIDRVEEFLVEHDPVKIEAARIAAEEEAERIEDERLDMEEEAAEEAERTRIEAHDDLYGPRNSWEFSRVQPDGSLHLTSTDMASPEAYAVALENSFLRALRIAKSDGASAETLAAVGDYLTRFVDAHEEVEEVAVEDDVVEDDVVAVDRAEPEPTVVDDDAHDDVDADVDADADADDDAVEVFHPVKSDAVDGALAPGQPRAFQRDPIEGDADDDDDDWLAKSAPSRKVSFTDIVYGDREQ